jgi:hypothetical protein
LSSLSLKRFSGRVGIMHNGFTSTSTIRKSPKFITTNILITQVAKL